MTFASDCPDILPSNNACRKMHPVGAWALKVSGMVLLTVGFQIFSSVHPGVHRFVKFVEEKLNIGEDLAVAAAQT